jgi:hypothetical protein
MKTERSRCHRLLLVACGALFLWATPSEAQTPSFTVSGRVVESPSLFWIGGATVRLSGRPVFITDSSGEFRFSGVPPGPHTLTVEAMGYRSHQRPLVVRADTVLLVEMEIDPVRMDSLLVMKETGTFTLRGRVTDGSTGRRLPGARVQADSRFTTFTDGVGSFRIKNLPRGFSLPVLVDAFKYLPARIALIAEDDTTLTIELEPDSLAIKLFEATVQRLENRLDTRPRYAKHLNTIALDRDHMDRTPSRSAYDVIVWRLSGREFSGECVFLDEVKIYDKGRLDLYDAAEIERIEIYGKGTMVRVYTQSFIADNLGGSEAFPPIKYLPGGLGPDICH